MSRRVRVHPTLHHRMVDWLIYSLKQSEKIVELPASKNILDFLLIFTEPYYYNKTDLEAMIITVLKPKLDVKLVYKISFFI